MSERMVRLQHRRLEKVVADALEVLFAYTLISPEETLDSLKTIRDGLDVKIEVLENEQRARES